jgi:hypothetical protein
MKGGCVKPLTFRKKVMYDGVACDRW